VLFLWILFERLMVLFKQLQHLQYHTFLNNILTFDWWGQFYGYLPTQDTWDKDVQALAKSTMQLLMWQAFSEKQLDEVAEAVLSAADQSNWHTRVAALTFLSPLVFRYTKP
jgi:hypothetical protein